MRSFFSSLLISTLFINVYSFDINESMVYQRSICLCNNYGMIGSGVLLSVDRDSYTPVLSCQHIHDCNIYDYFGNRGFFIRKCPDFILPVKLFSDFYEYTIKYLYDELIHSSHSCNTLTVNQTISEDTLSISKNCKSQFDMLGYINKQYLTFCESDVRIPIDISLLFSQNVDTSLPNIYELPTSNQINSWKDKTLKVAIYGYPESKGCECSITCNMKLTDCENWFKSLEPVPLDFPDINGMSGGPGFIEDEVLCGVVSGRNREGFLFLRALTTDLVEAIKFGVERFMDK